MKLNSELINILIKIRKKNKCPIYQLSLLSNFTINDLKRIEVGELHIDIYTLDHLLRLMNSSLSDLLKYKNVRNLLSPDDYKVIQFICELDKKIEKRNETEDKTDNKKETQSLIGFADKKPLNAFSSVLITPLYISAPLSFHIPLP